MGSGSVHDHVGGVGPAVAGAGEDMAVAMGCCAVVAAWSRNTVKTPEGVHLPVRPRRTATRFVTAYRRFIRAHCHRYKEGEEEKLLVCDNGRYN